MIKTAIEKLEDFVFECQMRYSEQGIIGDSSYLWEAAHHPKPKCLGGTETKDLLKEDHAIHGVLQSEVYQHPCIWGWEVDYLDGELLQLFKKWQSEKGRRAGLHVHAETNDEGKSIHGVKCAEAIHSVKNSDGKSVTAVKAGTAGGASAMAEKNEEGKSVVAVKAALASHVEKNEDGQSVNAVKAAEESAKKLRRAVRVTRLDTGEVFDFLSGRGAARALGILPARVNELCHGKAHQYKGLTAEFI